MRVYIAALSAVIAILIVFAASNIASICCVDMSETMHLIDTFILSIIVGLGVTISFLLKGGA